MKQIEVRIQATHAFPHRGEYDESNSYFLEPTYPVNAVGILGSLRKQNALEQYITENSIPANPKSMPLLFSAFNNQGDFMISLRSTIVGAQRFVIRILS